LLRGICLQIIFRLLGSAPLAQGTLAPGSRVQGMRWFAAPRSHGPFTLVYQPPDGDGSVAPFQVFLLEPMREWR
jgi:hypothetical protein